MSLQSEMGGMFQGLPYRTAFKFYVTARRISGTERRSIKTKVNACDLMSTGSICSNRMTKLKSIPTHVRMRAAFQTLPVDLCAKMRDFCRTGPYLETEAKLRSHGTIVRRNAATDRFNRHAVFRCVHQAKFTSFRVMPELGLQLLAKKRFANRSRIPMGKVCSAFKFSITAVLNRKYHRVNSFGAAFDIAVRFIGFAFLGHTVLCKTS